jgi:deoxyribodipyrimidine photo-lyase (single-stranded DNA-specific)
MQQKTKQHRLSLVTNNLRTQDNSALTNAIKNHTHVIAIYIFDKQQFTKDRFGFLKTEVFRAQFLIETVTALKNNLADLNISLFTYFGAPEVKIAELCQKFSINSMYTQKEWTRDEVHTANKVKNTLNNKVNVIEDYSQFLYHPNKVSKDFTNIPNVFTVFRKQVEKTVTVLDQFTVSKLSETNSVSNNTTIPSLKDLGFTTFKTHPHSAFPFKGGENEALKRLDYYLFESKKVSVYKKQEMV